MSRILTCAAVAALLAAPAVSIAQEAIPGYQPSAFEQSLAFIESRMEEFGARAEAIQADESLPEPEREARVMALWREYAPDLAAFTVSAAEFGAQTGGEVMTNIDVGSLVEAALYEADIEGQVARALAAADIEGQIETALAEANVQAAAMSAEAEDDIEDAQAAD